jgi:signal transduction histidine kinase
VTYANERWIEITGLRSGRPADAGHSGSAGAALGSSAALDEPAPSPSLSSLLARADDWQQLVHPDDHAALNHAWAQMHQHPATTTTVAASASASVPPHADRMLSHEFRLNRPDGCTVYVYAQGLPDDAPGGALPAAVPGSSAAAATSDEDGGRRGWWPPSWWRRRRWGWGAHRHTGSTLEDGQGAAMAINVRTSDGGAPASALSPSHRAPLAAASGGGLVCAFTDLTEHKRIETERVNALQQAAREQAARADEAEAHRREQERFVDVICHEIRNPLNGIVNNVDLLRTARDRRLAWLATRPTPTEAELAAWAQELREEEALWSAIDLCTQHQRRITDDVLEISRLHAGYFNVEPRPFVVADMVEACLGMVRASANSARVQLTCTLSPTCAAVPRVVGDAQRVAQVLMNFLTNAIKFTRLATERRVTVTVSMAREVDEVMTAGRGCAATAATEAMVTAASHRLATLPPGATVWIAVEVADTGIGMTHEEQARLFLPFRQANIKTYSTYGGSGMGLFISKAIADLLQGEIRVQSQPGSGSCFVLLVPCTTAEPSTNASTTAAVADHPPALSVLSDGRGPRQPVDDAAPAASPAVAAPLARRTHFYILGMSVSVCVRVCVRVCVCLFVCRNVDEAMCTFVCACVG